MKDFLKYIMNEVGNGTFVGFVSYLLMACVVAFIVILTIVLGFVTHGAFFLMVPSIALAFVIYKYRKQK